MSSIVSASDEESIRQQTRKLLVGTLVGHDIVIIDVDQTRAGDMIILCFNPMNPVHKFVTWNADPLNPNQRWSGHYLFDLDSAIADFHQRLGRD